ncbi:hypothetical protein EDC04DRAFT_2969751 [Pisolithus marmoratus]|nr:hypothetical protein EDC04DRAFT_2969751 [Pisolithus marmoratus]
MSEHDTIKPFQLQTKRFQHKSFKDWLNSAKAQGSDCRIYVYLEDTNEDLHGTWRELGQCNMAPETWGKASTSAQQFVQSTMKVAFPLLKFTENGWKLEYICTRLYPAWSKCYLEESGNLKRTGHNTVKEEAVDDLNGKKWKGHTEIDGSYNKQLKVETVAVANPPKVITPDSRPSATPPEVITATQLNVQQVSAAPFDKENVLVMSNVTQSPI